MRFTVAPRRALTAIDIRSIVAGSVACFLRGRAFCALIDDHNQHISAGASNSSTAGSGIGCSSRSPLVR